MRPSLLCVCVPSASLESKQYETNESSVSMSQRRVSLVRAPGRPSNGACGPPQTGNINTSIITESRTVNRGAQRGVASVTTDDNDMGLFRSMKLNAGRDEGSSALCDLVCVCV